MELLVPLIQVIIQLSHKNAQAKRSYEKQDKRSTMSLAGKEKDTCKKADQGWYQQPKIMCV
jgi:hypothetical protein